MKILILIVCSIFSVHAVSFYELFYEEWHLYKSHFKKNYKTDVEEKFRFKIFLDNKRKIEKHNKKFLKGEVTYKLGLNKYSDLLLHEMVQKFNGFKMTTSKTKSHKKLSQGKFTIPPDVNIPDSIDWVKKGAVTPVKDQGQCGSCWAFSATGALEGQHFRKYGYLISLSEQNLIDCSTNEGNAGCSGGSPDSAFSYVIKNNGIDTERSYPYEGTNNICRFNASYVGTTERNYLDVEPPGNETALKVAVATTGPVSVAIDASRETFFFYKSGVYHDSDCNSSALDHAVLVVGYGTDEETQQPYWLVKNSWGTSWGDKGFIKMRRNLDNNCGIASAASYPVV